MGEIIGEYAGKPLSYDLVLLKQLERIAEGIGDKDRTIQNIKIFEKFIVIDQDDEYRKDAEQIRLNHRRDVQSKAYNEVTRRYVPSIMIEMDYEYSLARLESIMSCLKRAGRFPAKFGVLDETEDSDDVDSLDKIDGEVEDTP